MILPGREFLLAGGRITFAEWVELSNEQRAALAEAGELIQREQAELIVDAIATTVAEFLETAQLERMVQKAGSP